MDILIYSYARPEYLKLTLNSLCFHSNENHHIHLAINKSDMTEKERLVINEVSELYPNKIETVLFLDNNYYHGALDCLYNYVENKKEISPVISISEDDVVTPVYVRVKYGCFLDELEKTITTNLAVLAGIHLIDYNHYESEPSSDRQKKINAFSKVGNFFAIDGLSGMFLTMKKELFEKMSNKLHRCAFDSEYCTEANLIKKSGQYSFLAFNAPMLHLAWHRQMDYPKYYEELVNQRVTEGWKKLLVPITTNPTSIFRYENNTWINSEYKLKFSWLEENA